MLTPLKSEITQLSDPSHEARRFRIVLSTFERNLELLFRDTGMATTVDHTALALAFSRWRQNFDATKHLASLNRGDYVIFAAGLMLKELIAAKPLTVSRPKASPSQAPAIRDQRLTVWPEGYAYTSFCLAFVSTIISEQGGELPLPSKKTEEAKFWDSFRENTHEDPATAVAFFDFICGQEPNWDAPDAPYFRPAFSSLTKLIK
jgi:hypothetical protein